MTKYWEKGCHKCHNIFVPGEIAHTLEHGTVVRRHDNDWDDCEDKDFFRLCRACWDEIGGGIIDACAAETAEA